MVNRRNQEPSLSNKHSSWKLKSPINCFWFTTLSKEDLIHGSIIFFFCVPCSLNWVFPYKIFVALTIMHKQLGLGYTTGNNHSAIVKKCPHWTWKLLKEVFALVVQRLWRWWVFCCPAYHHRKGSCASWACVDTTELSMVSTMPISVWMLD